MDGRKATLTSALLCLLSRPGGAAETARTDVSGRVVDELLA